jgi:hypothetical protein
VIDHHAQPYPPPGGVGADGADKGYINDKHCKEICMLIGFFTAFFLLGNQMVGAVMPGVTVNIYGQMALDVNQLRTAVRAAIPPDTYESTTRGNRVIQQIQSVTGAIDDYNEVFKGKGEEIVTLFVKYDSKPEDFRKVFSEVSAEREKTDQAIIEARFAVKKIVNPTEWKALFGPQG